jgi:inositol transport system substrate-binding protein
LIFDKIPMIMIIPKQCKDFLAETLDPRQHPSYDRYLEYRKVFLETMKGFPAEYKELIVTAVEALPVKVSGGSLVLSDGDGRGFFPEIAEENTEAAEGDEKTKTIYVLLTNSRKIGSRILQMFQLSKYAHSSIALDRDGSFYSFNPGIGFTTERPIAQKRRKDAPCVLYAIKVTDEVYSDIESRINWFIENPDEYKFNYAGMVLTILGIPVGMENRYFCSQFIIDLLKKSGALSGMKHSSRYLPRDFRRAFRASEKPRFGTVAELSDPLSK